MLSADAVQQFAAAQAALKVSEHGYPSRLVFAAAQAALKINNRRKCRWFLFAAAQAALKNSVDGMLIGR